MRGLAFFVYLMAGSASAEAADLLFERPTAPNAASPEIIGGSKLDPDQWPATLVFTSATAERCTATAIGPRVLLTAGHCIRGGAKGQIAGSAVTVECNAHENYSTGAYYDIALCFASTDIKLVAGAPYERIEVADGSQRGEQLMLLGYGCAHLGGAGGILYGGAGIVRDAATAEMPYFVTGGGAAVCSGDSGGGAYRVSSAISRRIVGIASAMAGGDRSNFAALADPDVAQYIRDWRGRRVDPVTGATIKADICGLDPIYTCHP